MKESAVNWDSIPDVITKDQLYRICHISKSTALYLEKKTFWNDILGGKTAILKIAHSTKASLYLYNGSAKKVCVMEKTVFEQMGGTCTRLGDYLLPNLTLPAEEERTIGIWGQWRRRYLKEHHRILYYNLLTACKLNGHLADVDRQSEELFSRLVKQMAEQEGVTEVLKARDQMAWVGRMNNIRNRATEIVNSELIYC